MRQELTLNGMSCGHCVMAVKEVLASIPGIKTELVEIGRVVVAGADLNDSMKAVETGLADEGYPIVSVKKLS